MTSVFEALDSGQAGVVAQWCQRSSPYTATDRVVPTSTLPAATVGVMNLLPGPRLSRAAFWPLL